MVSVPTTHLNSHVRFGSKADMCSAPAHFRFTPESDIKCDIGECPLWANSGHSGTIRSPRRPDHAQLRGVTHLNRCREVDDSVVNLHCWNSTSFKSGPRRSINF